MNSSWSPRARTLGLMVAMFASESLAFAGDFVVETRSVPIPFLTPKALKVDNVIEASAVSAIGDGSLLLVAHDKATPLQVVEMATGQLVGEPLTSPKFPNEAKIPPKWEGLASDSQGFHYVIGTHAGKSDEDRPSRSFLYQFRLNGGTEGSPVSINDSSIKRWRIDQSLKAALANQLTNPAGLDKRKIEGLAVRESANKVGQKELIIGLREPGDLVRVFAADISASPADGAELNLVSLFQFDAGQREGVASQLTSIEYVGAWQGFLIATATEDEANVFHGNTLWFVGDAQIQAGPQVKPEVVDIFEPAMKLEGITVLPDAREQPGSPTVKLALSFDNDPHVTKIPSRLQQVVITKRSPR